MKFMRIIKSFSFLLSLFIPRSSKILVFGDRSGNRFAENSRYLYLFLSFNSKFNCIWLTKSTTIRDSLKSKGLNSELSNSLKGIFFGFRANWHIFNHSVKDTNQFTSIGANQLNLWTGIQIKKLKHFVDYNKIYNKLAFLYKKTFKKKKFFLYPNSSNFSHITDHYYTNEYELLKMASPKNMIFSISKQIDLEKKYLFENEITEVNNLRKIKGKVIGYFPTWREHSNDFFIDLKNIEELITLDKILQKNESIILIKYHSTSAEKDKEMLSMFENLKSFKILKYDFDLNIILSSCDMLISDYSGIITDYLYINKPIVLYIPDIKSYGSTPGLNINYYKFDVGHKAFNFDTLLKLINDFLNKNEKFNNEYLEKRKKYFSLFFQIEKFDFEKMRDIISND